jgi:hypothetical protein
VVICAYNTFFTSSIRFKKYLSDSHSLEQKSSLASFREDLRVTSTSCVQTACHGRTSVLHRLLSMKILAFPGHVRPSCASVSLWLRPHGHGACDMLPVEEDPVQNLPADPLGKNAPLLSGVLTSCRNSADTA